MTMAGLALSCALAMGGFWLVRGPLTPLFRHFITSGIPLAKKLTICAYIGTYYAIAAAWWLSLSSGVTSMSGSSWALPL